MDNVREVNPSQAVLIACLALENHAEEDAVLATVGGEPIYSSQVDNYISRFRSMAGLSGSSLWEKWLACSGLDMCAVRTDTLNFLVDYLLIEKAARERSISVGQWDVQRHIETVMATPDAAAKAYVRLMRLGITEEQLTKGVRANLLRAALIDDISSELTGPVDCRYCESLSETETKIRGEAFQGSYEVFDRWLAEYRRSTGVEILRSG